MIVDNKKIKLNLVFFIYFLVMLCFYTNTLAQLLAQIILIIYVMLVTLKNKKGENGKIVFLLLWFGLFTFFVYISKIWGFNIYTKSNTSLTVFRIFIIGIMLFLYCNNKDRTYSVLYSFILASLAMCVILLITSYQDIGNINFGMIFGQHRNQVGVLATSMLVLTYYFMKNRNIKNGFFYCLVFLITMLATGSRGAILQIFVMIFVYFILSDLTLNKKIKYILSILSIIILSFIMLKTVPILRDTYYDRLINGVNTILEKSNDDSSLDGRRQYKTIALQLFKSKPIYGYGVDGFVSFLTIHPQRDSNGYRLVPYYAHSNYAELAADYGLIGIIIWYLPLMIFIIKKLKNSSNKYYLCFFISMIIMDYSRIPWATHLGMYIYFLVILLLRVDITKKIEE